MGQQTPKRVETPQQRRASSLGIAERFMDIVMVACFAVLGVILIVLAVLLSSTIAVVGGAIVIAAAVPLWLGGRHRSERRQSRLRWYPIAAAMLIIGLVVWVHPWG